MRYLLLAITFAISSAAFASTPATVAVSNLLPIGEYTGLNGSEKCTVNIISTDTSISVFITSIKNSIGFTVANSSNSYKVDSVTGEFSATQKFEISYYLKASSKVLYIMRNDDSSVISIFISLLAMDHRGKDMSIYESCTIIK